MIVFVGESAESVVSADVQPCEGCGFGDRLGQRPQWPDIRDASMRPVLVMVTLVLPQGLEQMRTVEDQGPVEELVAACCARSGNATRRPHQPGESSPTV